MHRGNWDDVRYVLAVAESGSVGAAARLLGVNHATVLRRVAAFEEAQGAQVLIRGPRGYEVAPERLRVIEAMREAALALEAVERVILGTEAQITGIVRITSTDTLCLTILPGIVARILSEQPGLRIDLSCTNARLDLARLDADISVRPAVALPPDLTGTEAGMLRCAAYRAAEGGREGWLGLRGPLARSRPAGWVEAAVQAAGESGVGADSFVVLRELAALGQGRAVLPCILAEGDVRLRRDAEAMAPVDIPLWVASHVDLAEVPRLKRLRERLAAAIRAEASRLSGEGPAAAPAGD